MLLSVKVNKHTYAQQFLEMIEADEADNPRSKQKAIGPSGLGEECIHCLGCMIAEVPKNETVKKGESSYAWSRVKGKLIHKHMEYLLTKYNKKHGERYLIEHRVMVGTILGKEVWGNSDAFDTEEGVVIDWKAVGETSRKKAERGHDPAHVVQRHLYGAGFVKQGYTVNGVMNLYLPVERNDLKWAVTDMEPYNPLIAEKAMKRANDIAEMIAEKGKEFIIPRLKRKEGCLDCPRYPL